MFWSCACQRGPSWGCWRGGFSSHKVFTHPLARLAYALRCLFLQGIYQQPWIFAFAGYSAVSDLDSHLRDPLRSWGSFVSFDVFENFRGGSKVIGKFSRCSRVSWLESHLTYSGVSALVTGSDLFPGISALLSSLVIWPSDRSFGGVSRGLLIPMLSLIIRVSRRSWQDYFAIVSNFLGSFLPSFCCSCIYTKKVSSDVLPYIRQAF